MNINNNFKSIGQVADQYLNQNKTNSRKIGDSKDSQVSFIDVLKRNIPDSDTNKAEEGLKFSKHASLRLQSRNIDLTQSQLERLNNGAKKASEKGINESLVVVDELSFIVNIPNKTVVTAMDQTENEDNVYTNIDGAVII
ncbi:flagellar operon protein [Acetitomaculum ruminis DSM 5522]|uniref:Flagellar operon protein n=1 Tax=Acetitomaculum ruminis DSM 5522 TaxID=1120918 RepID=A0A1I0ZH61_9FIRM|nr:TIGR02530 family flagellar biosynthesis protein [Acetitomaculum ruminis]SFB25099.1 flagellar operon protein [Acetitomaculum ruminis DSM 5522]